MKIDREKSVLKMFLTAISGGRRFVPRVRSDRWGNRSKYVPAGIHKNTQPHNR